MKDFKKAVIMALGFWTGSAIFITVTKAFNRIVEKEIDAAVDTDEDVFEDEGDK